MIYLLSQGADVIPEHAWERAPFMILLVIVVYLFLRHISSERKSDRDSQKECTSTIAKSMDKQADMLSKQAGSIDALNTTMHGIHSEMQLQRSLRDRLHPQPHAE